jgi:hypothetical protein
MRCVVVVAVVLSAGCSREAASEAPATPTSSAAASSSPTSEPDARACGGLGCRLYDAPGDAFRAVLEQKPLVLAVGEAHAQKATPGVPSSAKRFTTDMLPALEGKASDLVLELMVPPGGCDEKTKAVNKEMHKVTAPQAETNQNEYVVMGDAAKKIGIDPHLIHPTCDDFKAITAPGAEPTDVSLRLIARLMRETTKKALARNEKAGVEKIVVLYGGAIHNDLTPAKGTEDYGYGPDLVAYTKGRYVELDVFVPELVQDHGLWPKLVWYSHFDKTAHPDKATMFAPVPSSFTILLPATVSPP